MQAEAGLEEEARRSKRQRKPSMKAAASDVTRNSSEAAPPAPVGEVQQVFAALKADLDHAADLELASCLGPKVLARPSCLLWAYKLRHQLPG